MKVSENLRDKILEGIHLSYQKLVEKLKKEEGELVIIKDGKVVRVKARDLK
jgi:hypothetical protein